MTLEEQQNRIIDAYRDSSFGFWNALLSLNGILISAFSAVAIFGRANLWFVLCLVVASMISCGLLISNFKLIKSGYKTLGEMLKLPPIEERKRLTKEAEAGPNIIERNENIVEGLLFIQALIIILILLAGQKSPIV